MLSRRWVAVLVGLPVLVCGCGKTERPAVPDLQPAPPVAEANPVPPPPLPALAEPVLDPDEDRILTELAGARIPRDAKKQQARREAKLAWDRRTTVEAYDKVGKKDPKWDENARACLEAAARHFASGDEVSDDRLAAVKAAKRAIDLGCTDPLVLYVYPRLGNSFVDFTAAEQVALLGKAADALHASEYPAARKTQARINATAWILLMKPAEKDKKEAERHLGSALELLESALEETIPARTSVAVKLCDTIGENYKNLYGDRKPAIDKVAEIAGRKPEWRAVALCARGVAYQHYAWDARGAAIAALVPPEAWAVFAERLKVAEADLQAAWEADPELSEAAAGMIPVAMGQGWSFEEMDVWFKRAMEADGDNRNACRAKLLFLTPKWGGSRSALHAFGRACLETGDFDSGLPWVLIDAHAHLARRGLVEIDNYHHRQDYWEDFSAVYEGYLKAHPKARYHRAVFAKRACECGKMLEADELFSQLGDDDWMSVFQSQERYNKARNICKIAADQLRQRK